MNVGALVDLFSIYKDIGESLKHYSSRIPPQTATQPRSIYARSSFPDIWSDVFHHNQKTLTIYNILLRSSTLASTDPRDKAIGIYHLANDIDTSKFYPDYTKTTEDLCVSFTRWIIDHGTDLNVLSLVHPASNQNAEELTKAKAKQVQVSPSWAPDFASPFPHDIDGIFRHPSTGYKASRSSRLQHYIAPSPNNLRLQGVAISKVRRIVSLDHQTFQTLFSRQQVSPDWVALPTPLIYAILQSTSQSLSNSRPFNRSWELEDMAPPEFSLETFGCALASACRSEHRTKDNEMINAVLVFARFTGYALPLVLDQYLHKKVQTKMPPGLVETYKQQDIYPAFPSFYKGGLSSSLVTENWEFVLKAHSSMSM